MRSRLLLLTTLLVALSATPAAAATLAPIKSCYVSNGPASDQLEDVRLQGDAFQPEAAVEVLIDGLPVASAPTDAVGAFEVLVDPPYQPQGDRPFDVTVRDAVNVLTVQSRVTNLNVTMRPKRSAPHRRVRFRGRGFTQPAPVFAHYLYGGRVQKTVRLARRSTAPCGTFDVRRRQIPVEDPRTGRWIMQVDQKRAYSPEPDPVWVRLPIKVVVDFLEP
jgi:hypothetical protein